MSDKHLDPGWLHDHRVDVVGLAEWIAVALEQDEFCADDVYSRSCVEQAINEHLDGDTLVAVDQTPPLMKMAPCVFCGEYVKTLATNAHPACEPLCSAGVVAAERGKK